MSCNHCSVKFNFFHKEMGCSNCGLSFCNKCVKQKCKIPNKGINELPVCKACYTNLTAGGNLTPTTVAPPEAYLNWSQNSLYLNPSYFNGVLLRRLEALENPAAPPITIYKQDTKLQSLRTGLSPADQQLLDRLEKLKDDKNKVPPPSDDEIRRRLNSLKGENEYVEGPSKPVLTADIRSDQEKVDSLLDMFVTERDIELAHNPEEGIVARLATLREQGIRPNEGAYISNLHDSGSDEEVDQITKKIMDEVALEEKASNSLSNKRKASSQSHSVESTEEKGNSSPELPWCILCNKDAKYRCMDCDDLYCAECNTEVHKTWGDTDHRVFEYKQK